MKANKLHKLAFFMFLSSLAMQLMGLKHGWHDATTPEFFAGVLLNLSSIGIAAITDTLIPPRVKQEKEVNHE